MFFVIDENNNKIEAYDKEGVLAVLAQAIKDGSLSGITADSAFINKIKCCVTGQTNRIAFVTQAKYNELEANGQTENGVYYYIIDDDTLDGINNKFTQTDAEIESLKNYNEEKEVDVLLGEGATPASTVNIDKAGLYAVTIKSEDVNSNPVSGIISVPNLGEKTDAILFQGLYDSTTYEGCVVKYKFTATKKYLECSCNRGATGQTIPSVGAVFTDVRLLIKY